MIPTLSYAATSASAPLKPYSFDRRDPRDTGAVIEMLYCGVCHSDLHTVRDEWSKGTYPDPEHQRGVRAHVEERHAVSLRDR